MGYYWLVYRYSYSNTLVAVIAFCAKHIFGTNIEAGMAFMSTTTVVPTF